MLKELPKSGVQAMKKNVMEVVNYVDGFLVFKKKSFSRTSEKRDSIDDIIGLSCHFQEVVIDHAWKSHACFFPDHLL